MSDREVADCLEEMEALLGAGPGLEAAEVELWHQRFQEAVARAERGPEWPTLVTRAHDLSARIQPFLTGLEREREALKRALEEQTLGQRALSAYRSSAR